MAVETGSEAEIKEINGYQDEITITPLADWISNGKKGIAQADREIVKGDFLIPDGLPEYQFGQVDKQTAEQYFTLLSVILNDPTMPTLKDSIMEAEMLKQLETFNIGKGLTFDWDKLTADQQTALETGFKAGFESVRQDDEDQHDQHEWLGRRAQ